MTLLAADLLIYLQKLPPSALQSPVLLRNGGSMIAHGISEDIGTVKARPVRPGHFAIEGAERTKRAVILDVEAD